MILTTEQRKFTGSIAEIARSQIAPMSKDADASGHSSPDVLNMLAKSGLLRMGLPEEYGGINADHTTIALAVEELAKVDASAAMIFFVTQALIHILKQWANEEQKRRFFGKMANAPTVNAFSLTEANYGSESASIQTSATLSADHYLVNGTKLFVTNGSIADLVLVVVRTGEGEREKGLSVLIPGERYTRTCRRQAGRQIGAQGN